jgi:multicomponent Na+:H+ antiporter subunit B
MDDRLLKVMVKLLLPFIQVYGIFIILHGHITPGGGFSGGAILGASLILYSLTFGPDATEKIFPEKVSKWAESGGAFSYLVIGMIGVFAGVGFLANRAAGFSLGTPGLLLSAGMIPLLMIAIGIKVGSTLMTLFTSLLEGDEDA